MKNIILLYIFILFSLDINAGNYNLIEGPKVVVCGETITFVANFGLNEGKRGYWWTFDTNLFQAVSYSTVNGFTSAKAVYKVKDISQKSVTTKIQAEFWYQVGSHKYGGLYGDIEITIKKTAEPEPEPEPEPDPNNKIIENVIINASANTKVYSALNTILARNVSVASGANVDFLAGNSITIKPEFKVNSGANMRIYCISYNSVMERMNSNDSTDLEQTWLYNNSPNPFNGRTTISYHIAEKCQTACIYIHNFMGNLVRKIKLDNWGDGTCEFDAIGLPPGTYYYSLIVNGAKVDTKRMIYVE